jgi:hypothetical protein
LADDLEGHEFFTSLFILLQIAVQLFNRNLFHACCIFCLITHNIPQNEWEVQG